MNLPAETAVIDPVKMRDYLLSLDHADGRGKARYLALLGYTREHREQLARTCESRSCRWRPGPRESPSGA